MGIRESLVDKPARGVAVAAALVVVVLVIIAFQLRGSSSIATARPQAFFSVDDGKTWFVDDSDKIPPFDKDGKQAVRAYVYQCPDGTKFVNDVERYIPEAKRTLENAKTPDTSGKIRPNQTGMQGAFIGGREVKRPGDAKWVNTANFKQTMQITAIKCPNGGTDATVVEP